MLEAEETAELHAAHHASVIDIEETTSAEVDPEEIASVDEGDDEEAGDNDSGEESE